MNYPFFFFLFLILKEVMSKNLDNSTDKIPVQGNSPDSSSHCGDKLGASIGTISYKSFDSSFPNERCVWTIRAPNATSYFVYVDIMGSSNTLLISGFGLRGLEVHKSPSGAANVTVENSNVLVITFHVASTISKGFSLRYEASYSGSNEKASGSSEDIIVSANNGHVKFPSSRSTYDNNELSILLVTPLIGVYTLERKTEVIYIQSVLEDQSCHDRITVYAFERGSSTTSTWKSLGRMCGGVDSEIISNNDILMFKFESDGSGKSTGFHLYTRSVVV